MSFLKILNDKFEEYILIGSLGFNVVLIFLQVIMRYVFKSSLSWSEELARYIFIWQIWLGTSLAVKYNKHIRVDVIKSYLAPSLQKMLDDFVIVIWIGFIGFLASKSWQLTMMQFSRNQLSPAMRIPLGYAYAAVPVGCSLMIFRLVQLIYKEKFTTKKED